MIDKTKIEKLDGIHPFQFNYKGVKVSQRIGIEEYVALLKEEGVERIIEIGTNFGGFTTFLRDFFGEECEMHTFDIFDKDESSRRMEELDINFYCMDVFKSEEFVSQIINRDGKTLLICDGGNKPKEFQTFSKYLKDGDVIIGHDYSHDKETFNKEVNGKIWAWHELQYSDIKGSIKENELRDFNKETAAKYVFASYQK